MTLFLIVTKDMAQTNQLIKMQVPQHKPSLPQHTISKRDLNFVRNGSSYVRTFARSFRTSVDSVAGTVKKGVKTLFKEVDKLNIFHQHQEEPEPMIETGTMTNTPEIDEAMFEEQEEEQEKTWFESAVMFMRSQNRIINNLKTLLRGPLGKQLTKEWDEVTQYIRTNPKYAKYNDAYQQYKVNINKNIEVFFNKTQDANTKLENEIRIPSPVLITFLTAAFAAVILNPIFEDFVFSLWSSVDDIGRQFGVKIINILGPLSPTGPIILGLKPNLAPIHVPFP